MKSTPTNKKKVLSPAEMAALRSAVLGFPSWLGAPAPKPRDPSMLPRLPKGQRKYRLTGQGGSDFQKLPF